MASASSPRTLILVAHAGDEIAAFGGLLRGAIVARLDEAAGGDAPSNGVGVSIPAPRDDTGRLSLDELASGIRALGSFERVFTHDPRDSDVDHRDLTLAAGRTAGELWVPCSSGVPDLVLHRTREEFEADLEGINRILAARARARGSVQTCDLSAHALTAISSYARVTAEECVRAYALTHFDRILSDAPDCWGFELSPYERERYDGTCEILRSIREPPRSVLELGACEGAMTERLVALFPHARVRALECEPRFLERLRVRFAGAERPEILARRITDVPLEADLVLATEVLYYVADRVSEVARRISAEHLVTSYHGDFDQTLSSELASSGWREMKHIEIAPRYEPVDGKKSPLLVRRVGSTIRLWSNADHLGLQTKARTSGKGQNGPRSEP